MTRSHPGGCCGITRRGFLLGATAGAAAGASLTWLGLPALDRVRLHSHSPTLPLTPSPTSCAMPGPYPGRVIEVKHPGAVSTDHRISQEAVDAMIDRGMADLTGADHPHEAWRRFFEPGDVVGIKVNPVGRAAAPGETRRSATAIGAISSPEVILKVVQELKNAGVAAKDIILFERYADEFIAAGYDQLMGERVMDGVRWLAASANYDNQQVDIEGFDHGRDRHSPDLARHVAGYDPDVFVHMGFASPQHDPKDDRRFRSHLSVIVSRLINKLITIPCLKDHRSAGVTLALKNLSHGMNNNVARSHISDIARLDSSVSGPNQCNTFIPTAAGQQLIRRKATLHIMDGLIGVYEGGPGCWNRSWATWRHQALFFATDPVALDHVGWQIIDAKRAEEGWPPVAQMGLLQDTPWVKHSGAIAPLAAAGPLGTAALAVSAKNRHDSRATESFDVRQPQHIILAGDRHGMGVFHRLGIDHRVIQAEPGSTASRTQVRL